jgi:inner membrane protein
MDNVTHALAGSLLAAATCHIVERTSGEPSVAFRRTAFVVGVVMAELPDADLAYSGAALGMGKLGYLLHHRGHTHTVLFAIASAMVVWGLVVALRRDLRRREAARALLALSIVSSLSHVLLDFTNSYGVHPWWPIENRWVYGDAVFIVEPWLWIVALPPLIFVARGIAARVLFTLLLVAILGAAWRVEMVGTGVATVLTVGAVLWTGLVRAMPASRRVALALVVWLAVEGMFFAVSGVGRRLVRREVGASYRDVVLSPSPGNPLCLSALVVTEERGIYRATRATVAPLPVFRDAAACRPDNRGMTGGASTAWRDGAGIRWGNSWSAPVAELRQLAASYCEVAAALRFMRVPMWRRAASGEVTVFDLRYGEESFASLVTSTEAPCPHPVPNWEPPRTDLLGAGP